MQQLVDGTLQVGRAVSFVTEQDDVGTDTDAVPARPACQCVGASWATARQYPILCAANRRVLALLGAIHLCQTTRAAGHVRERQYT